MEIGFFCESILANRPDSRCELLGRLSTKGRDKIEIAAKNIFSSDQAKIVLFQSRLAVFKRGFWLRLCGLD